MRNINIKNLDGEELIKIAATLINVSHPIPEQGEHMVVIWVLSLGLILILGKIRNKLQIL